MLRILLRFISIMNTINAVFNGRLHKRLVNRSVFRAFRWR